MSGGLRNDNDTRVYLFPSQVNELAVTIIGGIFVLKLINTSNNTFVSTATVYNVSLNNDGINITCISDIHNPEAQDISETDSIDIGLYCGRP